MAQRDRSQGFGFMYVNIAKLLTEKSEEMPKESTPVLTNNVRTANFNKDTAAPAKSEPTRVLADRATAITQIRENLDRLQSLHHKLHAMLEELNRITDSSKSRKE